MKVVIIGSGNVAYHLAKTFKENNLHLIQIFGRNEVDLEEISTRFHVPYSLKKLEDADLYLIAVNDRSIEEVSKLITKKNCMVAHTSGSLPLEILQGNYHKASFYPLQTFSKKKSISFKKIPIFLEVEYSSDLEILKSIAEKISFEVEEITFDQRKKMHLVAVFVSNFANHLYAKANEISKEAEIPFHYFLPLIEETTEKIKVISPKIAQTGPAVRNDIRVLEMHRELLQGEALKIFDTMNSSIKQMYGL